MIEGVPVCTDHDPTKWHGLVKRNASGTISCTYGHEHKDDPRVLDEMFGSLEYGEISYPWQTSSSLGLENDAKHRVYDWMVAKDQPCKPAFGAKFSFDNMRAEVHADGNAGATVRFHSFFVQARACDPADPTWRGTISTGGHMDYGILVVSTAGGPGQYVPLPGDPSSEGNHSRGKGNRGHGSPQTPRSDFTWYGTHGIMNVLGIRKEDWGPVDPSDPKKLLFYGGGQNGSWIEPLHLFALDITPRLDKLDGKEDGYATYDGFTDRYGSIVPSCSPVGPDCVPLKLVNMKVGSYQFRADVAGLKTRDFDVKSPVTGKSLIQFPN
jgi:hypothetical protein